jgi:hypothetical protein
MQALLAADEATSSATSTADSQTLTAQIDSWTEKMKNALTGESIQDLESQVAFNQFCSESGSAANRLLMGFAYVHYSITESPVLDVREESASRETIVFKFKGIEEKVIANFDPGWPPLLPDASCFIIGKSFGRTIRLRTKSGKRESLSKSDIRFVFLTEAP